MSTVNFPLLPNGLYPAEIVKTKSDPTESGRGEVLTIESMLANGRKLWPSFDVRQDRAHVTNCARRDLAEFAIALNMTHVIYCDTKLIFHRVTLVVRSRCIALLDPWSNRRSACDLLLYPDPAGAYVPPDGVSIESRLS